MAKKSPSKFKGIFTPAGLLREKNLSAVDKFIIADIGYFNGGSAYRFTWPAMAKKLGIGQSTAKRAVERLGGKLGLLETIQDDYHHRELRLTAKAILLLDEPEREPKRPFIKPRDAAEVEAYARTIGFDIDGNRFIEWYEQRDWKQKGGNKLKTWQGAVRTWKQRKDNGDGQQKRSDNSNSNRGVTTGQYIR